MHTHMDQDDVPLLWTPAPRFVQIMRSGLGFQHPQYFFSQGDKLSTLLSRLMEHISAHGPLDEHVRAHELLSRLLSQSEAFSSITREQLRQSEPHVRAFVKDVQDVDAFVAEMDERQRHVTNVHDRAVTKKRAREDEDEDTLYSFKRRNTTCRNESTRVDSILDSGLATYRPWIQHSTQQRAVSNAHMYFRF